MRIYVASSWRNDRQPAVVEALRAAGHEVYDFKNPEPGNHGFHWSEIDRDWQQWDGEHFRQALRHPIALAGFTRDESALKRADACVLVLPCGRSAHLEAGYCIGRNKTTFILLDEHQEPELMYNLAAHVCTSIDELVAEVAHTDQYLCTTDEATERGYGLYLFKNPMQHCVVARSAADAWDVFLDHEDLDEIDDLESVSVRRVENLDKFRLDMRDRDSDENEPRLVTGRELCAEADGPDVVAGEEWADE